jgi:hypothetical protein
MSYEQADPAPAASGSPAISTPPGDEAPVVARIGELAVTSSTVRTPAGPIPLPGSTWQVTDHWMSDQKTAAWAIVVAILGLCVVGPFSLLFLLVKETTYRGTVQVVLTNGQQQYVARIPVGNQATVQHIHQQVNYVRSLAAL